MDHLYRQTKFQSSGWKGFLCVISAFVFINTQLFSMWVIKPDSFVCSKEISILYCLEGKHGCFIILNFFYSTKVPFMFLPLLTLFTNCKSPTLLSKGWWRAKRSNLTHTWVKSLQRSLMYVLWISLLDQDWICLTLSKVCSDRERSWVRFGFIGLNSAGCIALSQYVSTESVKILNDLTLGIPHISSHCASNTQHIADHSTGLSVELEQKSRSSAHKLKTIFPSSKILKQHFSFYKISS